MKKIVLRNIQAVGMHHYGRRELELQGTYRAEMECNNQHDPFAISVHDGSRKVGNLKRDAAKFVNEVMQQNKAKSKYFLRPVDVPIVKNRRIGPQQNCAIAFKCDDEDI